jgi:hypothetical protein
MVATVTDFVVAGLGSDGTAIVIATPEHHEAFADAIGAEGVDAAARDGRYMAVTRLSRCRRSWSPARSILFTSRRR